MHNDKGITGMEVRRMGEFTEVTSECSRVWYPALHRLIHMLLFMHVFREPALASHPPCPLSCECLY